MWDTNDKTSTPNLNRGLIDQINNNKQVYKQMSVDELKRVINKVIKIRVKDNNIRIFNNFIENLYIDKDKSSRYIRRAFDRKLKTLDLKIEDLDPKIVALRN